MSAKSPIIVDTSAFFAGTRKLRTIIEKGERLLTIDLIVFEFTKVLEDEIRRSVGSGNTKRAEMLRGLRDRFPKLLSDLEINVTSPEFSSTDVNRLYSMISKGLDSGDAMIWIKMQKAGCDTILTDNVSDWRELGAKVVTFDQ
ncbi:MAG: type II toxin-antitoxin system VapC family toxin [Nitrososphaerota archaeon]|jgi:predicted nucleic acid-binding protein|nr:type II toxin-antitoxin system VapC family toxin [Nitrososphaerota archaeon]